MPQNAFFLQTRDLLVSQKTMQRHFFSGLHLLSLVIFATATVLAFVLLCNSSFVILVQLPLLYTAWSNAYSEIGPEVMPRPLATSCAKDYKGHTLMQTSFTELPNTKLMMSVKWLQWCNNFFGVATHLLLKTTTTDSSREKFVVVDLCKTNDVSEVTAMRICNWMW